MKDFVARFVKDQSGATAIEYGLIAALVAVAIIGAARALGTQIGTTFNTVTEMQKGGARQHPLMLLGGAPPALKPPAQVQAALLFAIRWL